MLAELEPLCVELSRNREYLDRVVGQLTEQELAKPPREGEYSGRQTLAHLAGAERGMTALMRRMASGEQPRLKADYNNDYYNARQQEKRANMTVAQLQAELDESRKDLLAFIETLRPEDLDKQGDHPLYRDTNVRQVLQILQKHERDHAQEMDAWAQQLVAARAA
ncbi:MAG: DinB family protein [Anaerolineae bacterium]